MSSLFATGDNSSGNCGPVDYKEQFPAIQRKALAVLFISNARGLMRLITHCLVSVMIFAGPSLNPMAESFGQPRHGNAYAQSQTQSELNLNAQLLVAAHNDDIATVRRVLEEGAVVDSRNRSGDTALIIFTGKGNAELAKLLIDKGADINLRNLDKVSPLMTAAYGGHAGIARMLLENGADASVADQLGKTAMIYAAGQGHTEIIGLLLDAGVDVNRTYKHNLTALMWAAGYGRSAAVELLLVRGADAGMKDDRGKTASQIAEDTGHKDVAAILERKEER